MIIQINELYDFDIHNIKYKKTTQNKIKSILTFNFYFFKKWPKQNKKKKKRQSSENHQFWRWTEFYPVFLFPERLLGTYIFSAPTFTTTTTTIICLEPCALDAEFHHFILRYNLVH